MAQARGHVFLSARKFVQTSFGDDGVRVLEQRVGPEALRGVVMPRDWRPFEEYDAILRAIDEQFSRPAVRRLGRFACDDQLRLVHRIMMRLLRPAWLIENAMSVWGEYYDWGNWDIRWPKPNDFHATLNDRVNASAAYCEMLSGWLERFFERCAVRGLRVSHTTCAARGDARCHFDVTWQ
jgi:hypothetical protein